MSETAWQPGARIGELRLEEQIGRGGMGVVFRAVDTRNSRPFAIKTLQADATDHLIARFRREGEAQARVDRHPNILRIHSAGEHAGRLYIVMDLATGGDLKQRLKREGELPVDVAISILVGVARGLAHAHAHGVLHRDLKPGNVLFDERGTPQIVDFGVARLLDSDSSLTRTGDVVGTLTYMAPEQVDDGKRSDERSDVYALGALLYACLSGRPPLEGESSVGTIRAVLMDTPRPLREVCPDVPAAVAAVCARALEKDPEARQQSANAFADALEAAVAPPLAETAAEPSTRDVGAGERWGLAVLLAVVFAALVGVAGWSVANVVPDSPPSLPSPPDVAAVRSEGAARAEESPPEGAWAFDTGDELRLRFKWFERNFAGTIFEGKGRLALVFSGARPNLIVEAEWAFDEMRSYREGNASIGVFAQKELLEAAQGHVAFEGVVDTLTGNVDVRRDSSAVRTLLFQRPELPPPVSGADPGAALRFLIKGFYGDAVVPGVLRLLLSVESPPSGLVWDVPEPGRFRAFERRVSDFALPNIGGFVPKDTARAEIQFRVTGELYAPKGRLRSLVFKQTLTTPSGARSDAHLTCELE